MLNVHPLLRAVRIVIRADSDPARQALFANLLRAKREVRLVHRLHRPLRGTWAGAALVGLFGIGAYLAIAAPRNRRGRVLAVARHENAQRQVARVAAWLTEGECADVETGAAACLAPETALAFVELLQSGRLRRTLRVIRRVDARRGFLVACRTAAAIAWYARAKAILGQRKAGAVLVSSDSNPEEVGFVGAARALAIPQVFISHAYPTPLSPPLEFSLSILEGEAAAQARREKGPIRGALLFAGVEGRSAPLSPRRFAAASPVVGIFTPKAVSWPRLLALVAECRERIGAREVVIRWHPSMIERPQLTARLARTDGIVETARGLPVQEVAARCDWVIADQNSNVHLEVLKLGVPTVAIKGLGVYPESRADQYGFAANGIVFPPVASLREVTPEALIAFYSDGWEARFARYDGAYLQPPEHIAREVQRAMAALVERSAPAVVEHRAPLLT